MGFLSTFKSKVGGAGKGIKGIGKTVYNFMSSEKIKYGALPMFLYFIVLFGITNVIYVLIPSLYESTSLWLYVGIAFVVPLMIMTWATTQTSDALDHGFTGFILLSPREINIILYSSLVFFILSLVI